MASPTQDRTHCQCANDHGPHPPHPCRRQAQWWLMPRWDDPTLLCLDQAPGQAGPPTHCFPCGAAIVGRHNEVPDAA